MKNKIIEIIVLKVLDGMTGIGGIPGNDEFCDEFDMRLRAALDVSQPKEEPDWDKLREQYFEECVCDHPSVEGLKRVNMAPHNLFEWFKKSLSNPLKEEPKDSGWISVEDRLPEDLESVWISNGKGWTSLGCMHDYGDGWCWAESNGVIYQEGDKIVAECEADDLDVKFWMPLPDPPTVETKKD